MDIQELRDFSSFLLKSVYRSHIKSIDEGLLLKSFEEVCRDVKYHYPQMKEEEVWNRIITNSNELLIWLYRWGRAHWEVNNNEQLLANIHWLLKEKCASEVYFSSKIEEGFYVFHGEGLIIGSRNNIGKGLRIYQNCTIGHKEKNKNGVTIKNDVRVYSGAKVLGEITIGDNVIIGANTIVTKTIDANHMVFGNPNILKTYNRQIDLI